MRPGLMKRRITIERPTTTTNDLGGAETTYTQIGEYYAEVRKAGGGRGLEYEQSSWSKGYSITVRNNVDVLEDDLIKFESMTLVVSSIDRDWDKFRYATITANSRFKG
tara:strand:+ start:412 stop:735 length:324 start_codon:yes stop_codon:yes gene_type:complete